MQSTASSRRAIVGSFIVAPLLLVAGAFGQTSAITHVSIIDVEHGTVVPDQTILLDGDKIVGVGAASEKVAGKPTIVDGTGLFALPGLFDAHIHYSDPDAFGKMLVANGVVFVRDMGGFTESILETRDKLNKGELFGPEMIATGAIIDGKPAIWPFSEACDTPEEARAAVQKLKKAGVDEIKVYSLLKPDVYRAAVDEAKKLGLKAVGHIPASVSPDEALAAGQSSAEHLMQFDQLIAELAPLADQDKKAGDMLTRMSAWDRLPKVDPAALDARLKKFSGMTQCPTLIVLQSIGNIGSEESGKDPRLTYVSPAFQSFWSGEAYEKMAPIMKRNLPFQMQFVLAMHKAGVPIMVGTDLSNPHVFAGFAVHDEMKLLAKAGIPAADVLRDATIVPARFMGVDSRLGTIAKGKTASFILLTANPLDDISNTSKISSVYLRGKRFDRGALDGLLKEVRDHAAAGGAEAEEAKPVAVKLELPGKEIVRGRYTSTFDKFDAGAEDFLITSDADGFHLMAHAQPKGGYQPPSVVTMNFAPDWSFKSANYKVFGDKPLEANYLCVGKSIEVKATEDGRDLKPQTYLIPVNSSFSAPIYACDFETANASGLEVGKSKELNCVSFGWSGWNLVDAPMTFTRMPDEKLKRPDGKEVNARHYTSVLTTPAGVFKGSLWTDDRGVALKSETVMPFGTVKSVLK